MQEFRSEPMHSEVIRKGVDAAPARSLLRADGLKDADFDKPFIAIADSWNNIILVTSV